MRRVCENDAVEFRQQSLYHHGTTLKRVHCICNPKPQTISSPNQNFSRKDYFADIGHLPDSLCKARRQSTFERALSTTLDKSRQELP